MHYEQFHPKLSFAANVSIVAFDHLSVYIIITHKSQRLVQKSYDLNWGDQEC